MRQAVLCGQLGKDRASERRASQRGKKPETSQASEQVRQREGHQGTNSSYRCTSTTTECTCGILKLLAAPVSALAPAVHPVYLSIRCSLWAVWEVFTPMERCWAGGRSWMRDAACGVQIRLNISRCGTLLESPCNPLTAIARNIVTRRLASRG